ncbi:MAG TPA: YbjN domain-containing protein [Microthrixaceae bacterium]|nr:YbjN domain-containing protein [Microthrixaceae bacterium]
MEPDPSTPEELDALEALIDAWAAEQLAENPTVDAVERDTESGDRRWFVRLLGEEKAVFSVWIWLRQRSLHVETYFMPAPEENQAQLYEHLLRRNLRFFGFTFAIGLEDAVFLVAQIPNATVTVDELDRLLGSAYVYVEQCFRPAMRLGYASKFKG